MDRTRKNSDSEFEGDRNEITIETELIDDTENKKQATITSDVDKQTTTVATKTTISSRKINALSNTIRVMEMNKL